MHLWRLGPLALAVTAAVLAVSSPPVAADTVILRNGDILTGEVQLSELTVSTAAGPIKVGRQDVARVVLGVAEGDVVVLRARAGLTGQVEQAAYQVRLASGATVAVGRHGVAVLILGPR